MLNNLSRVGWKQISADIDFYMLISLVSLQQENSKKSKKSLKFFIFPEQRKDTQISKDVAYDNIKSHKITGFHPLSRENIFEKTTVGANWLSLRAFLVLQREQPLERFCRKIFFRIPSCLEQPLLFWQLPGKKYCLRI